MAELQLEETKKSFVVSVRTPLSLFCWSLLPRLLPRLLSFLSAILHPHARLFPRLHDRLESVCEGEHVSFFLSEIGSPHLYFPNSSTSPHFIFLYGRVIVCFVYVPYFRY